MPWKPIGKGDVCTKCGHLETVEANDYGAARFRCESCDARKLKAAVAAYDERHAPATTQDTPSTVVFRDHFLAPDEVHCQGCAVPVKRGPTWATTPRLCPPCLSKARAAGPEKRRGTKVDTSRIKPAEFKPKACKRCPTIFTPTVAARFLCETCRLVPYVRPKTPAAPRPPKKPPKPRRTCSCGRLIEVRRGRPRAACDTCLGPPRRHGKAA